MRRLNVSIAVVGVSATIAMLIGFVLKNVFGFEAAPVSAFYVSMAVAVAAVLSGLPSLLRYARLRHAATALGLRPTEWVLPKTRGGKQLAWHEPRVYVAILQAMDDTVISPEARVDPYAAAFVGHGIQRAAGDSVYLIVRSLVERFYFLRRTYGTDSRVLVEWTAACLAEHGATAVAEYFQRLNAEDALSALREDLTLEYAQQIFPAPSVPAYSGAWPSTKLL